MKRTTLSIAALLFSTLIFAHSPSFFVMNNGVTEKGNVINNENDFNNLETWMSDFSGWLSDKSLILENDMEESLSIEAWMTNVGDVNWVSDFEANMGIETWMTDVNNNSWLETSDTEETQKLENWMIKPTEWLNK